MVINLAKALRVKNSLVNKLATTKRLVTDRNSYNIINPPKFNVKEEMAKVEQLTENLVELKTKISVANKEIAEQLHLMEELKSTIKFLTSIDTKEGKHGDVYGDSDKIQEFAVTYTERDILEGIEKFQKQIEEIQDQINKFNFTKTIELSFDF
jgi:hypothetical protein